MKILFIVPYTPNLIRTRPYNLIRALSRRGHQVILATLWSSDKEQESVAHIRPYCEAIYSYRLPAWKSLLNCLAVLPTDKPLQSAYCWQESLAEKILSILEISDQDGKIDIIHVEHLRGVRYGLHVQAQSRNNHHNGTPYPPVVWDSVDNISYLFRQSSKESKRRGFRWLTQLELSRTESYERWLLSQFPITIVTSRKDKEVFLDLLPVEQREDVSITVLPNGVDLDYFTPGVDADRAKHTLVVSGKMSYHANVSMVIYLVSEIMPRVWNNRADTELWIVGKDPTAEIIALGKHKNILVTGTVDDMRPYLQRATVAVSPLTYGAGIQNKVLESMACATPVVATSLAVSSLDTLNGRDVLVADQPDGFAKQILRLLDDEQLCRRVGQSGRLYVEKNHNWTNLAAVLEGVYDAIVKDRI